MEDKIEKIKEFISTLPFELTADQKKSSWEILQETNSDQAMSRLLQGDVGSGKTIVGAVLNAPDMWNASKDLLDYGFKAYTWRKFVSSSEALCTVKIDKGVEPILEILPEEDILIPLRNEEAADAVTLRLACPKTLPAPVKKGQQVGKIEAWCDGRLLACVSLSAAKTVMRKEYPYYLEALVRGWLR